MSRDWTPREFYMVEQHNLKNSGISIFESMISTTWSIEGSPPRLLHSPEEMAKREQYPVIGKLYGPFVELYKALSQIPGGLDFLKQRDSELAQYIATGVGNKEDYLIKWFEGELDEGFYYRERNDEMFMSEILTDARTTAIAYPRKAGFADDFFDLESIDANRLTERSNARLCFDSLDGKEFVCVDLCYDNHKSLPACDVTCVYSAPVTTESLDEARDALYQISEKFHIPAFDEDDAALVQYPVRVALIYAGEGIRGDYDPKDPDDIQLLRFNVSVCRDGIWEEKEDGSYCSCLPLNAGRGQHEQALSELMNAFYPILSNDVEASIKKVGEKMSYIGIDYPRPSKPSLDERIRSASESAGKTESAPRQQQPDHKRQQERTDV